MKVIRTSADLNSFLREVKREHSDYQIGFVPTMGALHAGHLALIDVAKKSAEIVVCSIFVNPTQFNNKKDLERYPRNEQNDINLLEKSGCDVAFIPTVKDVYPVESHDYHVDLGPLDKVMEGKFRPGHFRGVAMVVERFFKLVRPDIAFFGEKDFQQLAVIRRLVDTKKMKVKIVGVPTLRSRGGLALSSRNELLSPEQKEDALIIYKTLSYGREVAGEAENAEEVRAKMLKLFSTGKLQLEYLDIVDSNTFETPSGRKNWQACIAAYCGTTRLIDNMKLS